MTVAQFDIIPDIDDHFESIFGPHQLEPVNINFESLGYETPLSMHNMGSLYFILMLEQLLFIITLFYHCFQS